MWEAISRTEPRRRAGRTPPPPPPQKKSALRNGERKVCGFAVQGRLASSSPCHTAWLRSRKQVALGNQRHGTWKRAGEKVKKAAEQRVQLDYR